MGESREAKRARLDRRAAKMREKYSRMVGAPSDKQEAARRGYNDAVAGLARKPPFVSPPLRAAWRAGFDIGTKGLKVKIPPQVSGK